jgi:hypothetical protein
MPNKEPFAPGHLVEVRKTKQVDWLRVQQLDGSNDFRLNFTVKAVKDSAYGTFQILTLIETGDEEVSGEWFDIIPGLSVHQGDEKKLPVGEPILTFIDEIEKFAGRKESK